VSQSLPNQVNDFNREQDTPGPSGPDSVAIPSKPGQRLQLWAERRAKWPIGVSQSLPNQVNDFNMGKKEVFNTLSDDVAIPSKPGQRLQSLLIQIDRFDPEDVAIPSKPGQRLQ